MGGKRSRVMGEQRRHGRAKHGAQRTAEQVISSKWGLKTVREREKGLSGRNHCCKERRSHSSFGEKMPP